MLADVAQQVDAGARHITFGDPDFFNGVHHSLRVVRALHNRFPDITFDCTVKVEHILAHADVWPEFAASGCLFVVSAFETVDDDTLAKLDKGHTAAGRGTRRRDPARARHRGPSVVHAVHTLDDARRTSTRCSRSSPRTTWSSNVDPVQYTIRLLIPQGSLVLGLAELAPHLGRYDDTRGTYEWTAADPALDALQERLATLVEEHVAAGTPTRETYGAMLRRSRLRTAGGSPGSA